MTRSATSQSTASLADVEKFPGFIVRKSDDDRVSASVEQLSLDALPAGEVVIEVAYSSLNYKDALACQGHPGVVCTFPHVPGIDCAGVVASSSSDKFSVGDEVLVTGYGFGAASWGGFAACARVPADWVVPLPKGLSIRESMILGTAGFTAAQSVEAIVSHGIEPSDGTVLVTGATGGVGSISVALLARLGYRVAALTGKQSQHDLLRSLGADEILGREELSDETSRPLLRARWCAAVDTVGGAPLGTVLRSIDHRGCVAACGMVAGVELPLTVYPFILRGVKLAGIDSAQCPRKPRLEIWDRLADSWKIDCLELLAKEINLSQIPEQVEAILASKVTGRTLVRPTVEPAVEPVVGPVAGPITGQPQA